MAIAGDTTGMTGGAPGADGPADGSEPIISIRGMHKWFGQFHVLKDVDLEVKRGSAS